MTDWVGIKHWEALPKEAHPKEFSLGVQGTSLTHPLNVQG